jgi:hypothetical protein
MGVTDEDRRRAIEKVRALDAAHEGLDLPGQMSAAPLEGVELWRRGLLGEAAFANRFGDKVDSELNLNGDGGRDFTIELFTGRGFGRFKVDVKTASLPRPLAELTPDKPHLLAVPCHVLQPTTIYVDAVYMPWIDDAEVIGWEWGRMLIRWNDRRIFKNSKGRPNFVKPHGECRTIEELESRTVRPEPPEPPELGLPDHRPSLAGQAIRLGIQWRYVQGLWP